MIKGVLFDKDGTLFDFRKSWGRWTRGMLEEFARDEAHADAMATALGYDLVTDVFAPHSLVVTSTSYEIAETVLPHLPGATHEALVARFNQLAVEAEMVPAVPLALLLSELRERGLRIGLATNDVEEAARAHLSAHGVESLFDFIAGSDSGHGAKPAPGMLLAFAHAQGVSPGQVLMVGDSAHDLVAGKAAGMRPIGVLTGPAEHEDLAHLAEVVLPSIGALPAWIDGQHRASVDPEVKNDAITS